MPKYINLYSKMVKSKLPVHGQEEKQFINDLRQKGEEILQYNSNLTFEDFIEEMGSPDDVVAEYLKFKESDVLISQIDKKKVVKKISLIIFGICLMIIFYVFYQVTLEVEKSKNQRVDKVEVIIEE